MHRPTLSTSLSFLLGLCILCHSVALAGPYSRDSKDIDSILGRAGDLWEAGDTAGALTEADSAIFFAGSTDYSRFNYDLRKALQWVGIRYAAVRDFSRSEALFKERLGLSDQDIQDSREALTDLFMNCLLAGDSLSAGSYLKLLLCPIYPADNQLGSFETAVQSNCQLYCCGADTVLHGLISLDDTAAWARIDSLESCRPLSASDSVKSIADRLEYLILSDRSEWTDALSDDQSELLVGRLANFLATFPTQSRSARLTLGLASMINKFSIESDVCLEVMNTVTTILRDLYIARSGKVNNVLGWTPDIEDLFLDKDNWCDRPVQLVLPLLLVRLAEYARTLRQYTEADELAAQSFSLLLYSTALAELDSLGLGTSDYSADVARDLADVYESLGMPNLALDVYEQEARMLVQMRNMGLDSIQYYNHLADSLRSDSTTTSLLKVSSLYSATRRTRILPTYVRMHCDEAIELNRRNRQFLLNSTGRSIEIDTTLLAAHYSPSNLRDSIDEITILRERGRISCDSAIAALSSQLKNGILISDAVKIMQAIAGSFADEQQYDSAQAWTLEALEQARMLLNDVPDSCASLSFSDKASVELVSECYWDLLYDSPWAQRQWISNSVCDSAAAFWQRFSRCDIPYLWESFLWRLGEEMIHLNRRNDGIALLWRSVHVRDTACRGNCQNGETGAEIDEDVAKILSIADPGIFRPDETREGQALIASERAYWKRLDLFFDLTRFAPERRLWEYVDDLHYDKALVLSFYFGLSRAGTAEKQSVANVLINSKGLVSNVVQERLHRPGLHIGEEIEARVSALAELIRESTQHSVSGSVRARLSNQFDSLSETDEVRQLMNLMRSSAEAQAAISRTDSGALKIQHALKSHELIIDYVRYDSIGWDGYWGQFRGKSRYAAMIITPEQIEIRDIGTADSIDTLIKTLRKHFSKWDVGIPPLPSADDSTRFHRLGRALYDALLSPLDSFFKDSTLLVISPDAKLCSVPFACLVTPEDDYVIEHWPVQYLASPLDLLRQFPRDSRTDRMKLVIGDPLFLAQPDTPATNNASLATTDLNRGLGIRCWDDFCAYSDTVRFGAVNGAKLECEEIGRSLGCMPITGQEASESNFRLLSKHAKIIHIATHGFHFSMDCNETALAPDRYYRITPQDNPFMECGLAFAGANPGPNGRRGRPPDNDGILWGYEVLGLDLTRTDIVTLSACNTGVGSTLDGESAFGLTKAFQMAGARQVIGSLWSIPGNTTEEMFSQLYDSSQVPLYERLRDLQLRVITKLRQGPRHEHPWYWGAFVTIGRWR